MKDEKLEYNFCGDNIYNVDETGISSNVSHFDPSSGQREPFERNGKIIYRKERGRNFIKIKLYIGSLMLLAQHAFM
jgi:hypothetical protein